MQHDAAAHEDLRQQKYRGHLVSCFTVVNQAYFLFSLVILKIEAVFNTPA